MCYPTYTSSLWRDCILETFSDYTLICTPPTVTPLATIHYTDFILHLSPFLLQGVVITYTHHFALPACILAKSSDYTIICTPPTVTPIATIHYTSLHLTTPTSYYTLVLLFLLLSHVYTPLRIAGMYSSEIFR